MRRKECCVAKSKSRNEDFGQKKKWNSSSSFDESEEHANTSKRSKHSAETPVKSADFNRESSGAGQNNENCFNAVFQNNQFESFSPINSSPSPILGRYIAESNSPILGLSSFITKSDSPVLFQRQIERERSPVLANLEISNSIRMRRKARKLRILQCPQDFIEPLLNKREEIDFPKYENDLITIKPVCSQDKVSTDNHAEKELIKIEPICSPKISTVDYAEELVEIEPICSQNATIVDHSENELVKIERICSQESSSLSTVDQSVTSSGSSNASKCYHQPKMRKKHCKPGGLLHQIQQTINLQASRISLWHHDIYWKKTNPSQLEYIQCHIQNYQKEYGCTIFKCSDFDNKEQFLVCLGHNTTSVLFDVEYVDKMKIFPPFKEKWIKRDNKQIKLYYNVTKILLDKMHKPINVSLPNHKDYQDSV